MQLIDAVEMNEKFPETFELPSAETMELLSQHGKPDTSVYVKVSDGKERFWVEVSGVDGDVVHGQLSNKTLFGKPGMEFRLLRKNIFDVMANSTVDQGD